MKTQTAIPAALAAILGATTFASATVIMSDNFDGRTNGNAATANGALDSDWGSNNNALSGTVVQTYVTSPDRTAQGQQQTVQGDKGILRFGAAATSYDLHSDPTVVANKGYTVQFDFQRLNAAGFVSIFFGAPTASVAAKDGSAAFGPIDQDADYADLVEAAFLFQSATVSGVPTPRTQVWNFGEQVGTNIDNAWTGLTSVHTVTVDVSAPNGFGAGNTITYTASIDGNAIPGGVVNAISDGGIGNVGWSSNQGGSSIDNFSVTSIPEPASLGLLGVGALAMGRRRRA
jgi:hypothetical protein